MDGSYEVTNLLNHENQLIMQVKEIVETRLTEKQRKNEAMRMGIILFLGASTIIFLAFLIIANVRGLPEIAWPKYLQFSTISILLSSIFLVLVNNDLKNDHFERAQGLMLLVILNGALFGISQVSTLGGLLVGEVPTDLLLPVLVVHFTHIVIGLALLIIQLIKIRKFEIHSRSINFANNVSLFWHFLSILWIGFLVVL